jgi:hypothetical protein
MIATSRIIYQRRRSRIPTWWRCRHREQSSPCVRLVVASAKKLHFPNQSYHCHLPAKTSTLNSTPWGDARSVHKPPKPRHSCSFRPKSSPKKWATSQCGPFGFTLNARNFDRGRATGITLIVAPLGCPDAWRHSFQSGNASA